MVVAARVQCLHVLIVVVFAAIAVTAVVSGSGVSALRRRNETICEQRGLLAPVRIGSAFVAMGDERGRQHAIVPPITLRRRAFHQFLGAIERAVATVFASSFVHAYYVHVGNDTRGYAIEARFVFFHRSVRAARRLARRKNGSTSSGMLRSDSQQYICTLTWRPHGGDGRRARVAPFGGSCDETDVV